MDGDEKERQKRLIWVFCWSDIKKQWVKRRKIVIHDKRRKLQGYMTMTSILKFT